MNAHITHLACIIAAPGYWWHRHHPALLEPTAAANFHAPDQG